MRELIIGKNEAGQRLDKFLAKYMDKSSKSFFYKMMRKKNIVLNGKKCQGNEILVLKDSVKLFLSEDTINKFSSNEVALTKQNLAVIYEDENIMLINKPAGMLTQKSKKEDVSLVEHIISYMVDNQMINHEDLRTFRPSPCNRLDRNTSGIVAAGKSLKGLQALSEAFKDRTLGKYYLTIVKGEIKSSSKLNGYLVKDRKNNQVTVKKQDDQDGDYIETSFRPIKSNGNITLLEVHLITGKTHQIRAHLNSIGHPIIGDSKYGCDEINRMYKMKFRLNHQLLHAYRLEFPSKFEALKTLENKQFIAPLPNKFKEIISELGVLNEFMEF